jgi:hypothetical protein
MVRLVLLSTSLGAGLPPAGRAQLPLFVAGFAGGAFDTDDNGAGGGSGGFAYQTDVGVRLPRVSFGAEFGQHNTGGDLKSKVYGGFVRLAALVVEGPVQVYLVAGIANYRFSPSGGRSSSTVGGSVGPGVTFRLRGTPAAVGLEARYHSTFDQLPRINNQQFVSVLGGLQLSL